LVADAEDEVLGVFLVHGELVRVFGCIICSIDPDTQYHNYMKLGYCVCKPVGYGADKEVVSTQTYGNLNQRR